MVFTIGICDDCPEQIELFIQYLNNYQNGDEFTIVKSTDPEDFLMKLEVNKPQLVFLDIDMGEMSGIQLGEKIKALYKDTIIVYITAYEKYALEAFRVRAFHYLLKPLTEEKFHYVLEEALRFIKKESANEPAKTFTVQTKGEIVCLNYSDILYFEKIGHRIKVHTVNRDIYYYGNLARLIEQIDANSFIQCHQGYIANVDKIRGFRDKTLFLNGNLQLPVSRSFAENVKEMLAGRLFAGKEEQ
ncbi:MAG: LytTR family DNA-binding domain-containing protein [Syntrophomonas sp.]